MEGRDVKRPQLSSQLTLSRSPPPALSCLTKLPTSWCRTRIAASPGGKRRTQIAHGLSRQERVALRFSQVTLPFPKMLITGNLAKNLYDIPDPASSFGSVTYFSINFSCNTCDLPGIAGCVSRMLNNLIPTRRPEEAGAVTFYLCGWSACPPLPHTAEGCFRDAALSRGLPSSRHFGGAPPPPSLVSEMPVKARARQGQPPGRHTLTWLLSKPLLCDVIPSLFWRFSIAISS